MHDAIEFLGFAETIGDVETRVDTRHVAPSEDEVSLVASRTLRQASERWSSSLGAADLACLLKVLEVDLIPQLLNSYSPSRYAPLDVSASSM